MVKIHSSLQGLGKVQSRDNDQVGVIIFTGEGDEAFCSGGDINVRGNDGYLGDDELSKKGIGRLNVLDLQVQIRRLPVQQ